MAGANRPARLNRSLLLVIGVVLLLAAAFALLTRYRVLALVRPDAPLTLASDLPGWAPWVAAAASVLLGLACLRWLLAQALRSPKTGTWSMESDPMLGRTRLDAQVAVDPLVAEVEDYPEVHRAAGWLSGTVRRPTLHLVVGCYDDADVTALRRRIDGEAVPRLQRALELTELRADLLLRLDDATATAHPA